MRLSRASLWAMVTCVQKKGWISTLPWVACCLAGILFGWTTVQARQQDAADKQGWRPNIHMDWGGHVRAIGTVAFMAEDAIYRDLDPDPYEDGQLEWRLKNRLYLGSRWALETHYELVALGGDTVENNQAQVLSPSQGISDDHRLFDLTRVFTQKDRYLAYHRLDRLHLTWTPDWGTLRLGRQALTWGDGLVFNPMDLFNPFAPTSVLRDYKTGDDMAHLQCPIGQGEMQFLYLPRRAPETGDLRSDRSSCALKYHAPAGAIELDLMVAHHYDDAVAGMGASGYLGGAAWRFNATHTHLSGGRQKDDFFQIVANVDYAWMWGGRNVYGLLEGYFNGLGRTGDYAETITDTGLVERLDRGELYTIGRYYLAGQMQIELHPLVQLHTTAIVNVYDPSGVLQPQVLWDVTGDLQMIAGAQWFWGGGDSEYGGYDAAVAGSTINMAPSDRIYVWLTYHF